MNLSSALVNLNRDIVNCNRCPRLRSHCRKISIEKRRAYMDADYWGRPVPSFGDPSARLLIVGLAPGAHGANRTGRMFTGDRSGEFLCRALYRAGFSSQQHSVAADDGLVLCDAWITAPVRCAPPGNKPTAGELRNCRPWLEREAGLMLPQLRAVVALGRIAFGSWLSILRQHRRIGSLSDYRFGHGVVYDVEPALIASYHPSQQNTSTGRLTQEMLDRVFLLARDLIRFGRVRAGSRR